jgi:hypothetical protein
MFSQFLEKQKNTIPTCEKRKFFVAEEELFFTRLQKALPNCHIFPQVQLAAILEAHVSNEKNRQIMRQELEQRRVDFAIFDQAFDLLCVVELDGELKEKEEKFPTRQLLKSAGIKSIRWNTAALPSFEQVLRTLAPFSDLSAPKVESSMKTIGKLFAENAEGTDGSDLDIYTKTEHGNPNALSLAALERLAETQFIKSEYPHIWKKICLFAGDPGYLKNYLESLFVQNRAIRRKGLPKHVANEVIAIQSENTRFTDSSEKKALWDPTFFNR